MALLTLPLTEVAELRLAAGAPELRIDELGAPSGLEPGRPLRLVDRGGQVVAAGLADPENEAVRLWARGAAPPFDAAFFRRRVEAAIALRRATGLWTPGESFRLLNSEGDGLSGLTVDVYGPFAVICALARGLLPAARQVGAATLAAANAAGLPLRGVVLKVRGKDAQDRSGKDEILGERPPEKLVVHEAQIPYEVHLTGSLNVGLFTDMREHRRGLARFCPGRRVLNTFAYTGALSVAAARAGAAAVTSVDLSGGVLAWAKENFRLSGLEPGDARFAFEASDVRRYLERAQRDGAAFDVIILDPPTVSAARAAQWTLKRDYPDLIASAVKLLPSQGGLLWVSQNARKGGPGATSHAIEGLRRAGRAGTLIEQGGLPPDYPTLPGWPEGRYLDLALLWVAGLA
jgi:23S rRNA (cytosine1962-C5)-methyltransferase